MKYNTMKLLALVTLTGARAMADNFVTITPTGATAATVTTRWAIGSNLSGLGYIDGNSGFGSATATNFFSITGAPILPGGSPTGFMSYVPTGAATAQGSVGNALTPNSYSGLTYVAENLSLIGPLSFYTIHHRTSGDYLALIQPATPTVSDQKPMSVPGTSATGGATGYFALSYAAADAGGWGANLFYYLRTNGSGQTVFGSLVPALLSGPTDRWNLGSGRGFTDLAYTATDIGFGFGPGQFYYLRLDPVTQTTFFGRLNPLTGIATDIQNLGGVYRTLVFTPTNVGYGANLFYTIGRAAQTISFAPIGGHTACDLPFTFVAPTSSAGLPVTVGVSGPATVSGNTVTLTGAAGTVVLTATQPGDSNFAPAPVTTQSFVVTSCAPAPAAQTITFAPIANRTACDAPFTFVAPVASSGLPVTLSVSGPATLSGNTVTLTGAVGTVILTAAQAGNTNFAAAPNVAQSIVVAACVVPVTPQTITFGPLAGRTACDAPFTFVAPVASSGLPVALAVSGPATLSGNTLTLTGALGTVTLTATQAGSTTFAPATTVVQSFAVAACPPAALAQVITFAPVADRGLCDATFTVNPTSTSGLPVALIVASGPATISGNTVTVTGTGNVTLQAVQAGNSTYAAAAPVSRTFAAAKCAATVTLTNLTNVYFGNDYNALEWIDVSTTPAGLRVILTHEGNTSVPAAVRSYTVVGTIDSPIYAGSTTATLVISADARVGQTVTFGAPLPDRVFGDSPFTLNPSASSGLPTSLRVVSGPATLAGNTVTLTGAGTVVLEVIQAGHILTHTFAALTQSFVVSKKTVPVSLSNLTQAYDGSPKNAVATTTPSGFPVNITYNGSTVAPSAAGSYAVHAEVNDPNHQGSADGTLTIASSVPAPVITNNPLTAAGTVGSPFNFAITATGSPSSYTATPLPAGLSVASGTGIISGTPTSAGTTNVLLGATNGGGTANATVTITVAPAGQAPIITNNPLSAGGTTGTPFSLSITASGSPTSYSASALPPGLSMGTTTGIISGTPTAAGTTAVLVGATNATGTGNATVTITVAPSGAAPLITNNPLTAGATVGTPFNFSITASGSPSNYAASALPAGLSIVPATGAITGTPLSAGSTAVQISASNSSGTGTATLIIAVVAPNSAPVIINNNVTPAATVGAPFGYTIAASGTGTTFGATGLPPGLALNPATGVISGSPTLPGTSIVTLTASNNAGTATSTLTITVAPRTVPPVITSPTTAPGTVGSPFVTYLIAATGLPTTYSATGLPAGLTLDPLTGAINGTPTTSGTSVVTLTATNSAGSSTATLTMTIAPLTVAPVITSPTTAAGAAGTPLVTYLIAATGLPTSYSVSALPAGLTLNPLTGAITGTPTFPGTSLVTLNATNSAGTGTAVLRLVVAEAPSSRIVNFSARAVSGPGAQTLIMGFVVSGNGKNLLVRGVGPGLAAYGVTNVLADPMLTVFSSAGAMATNDDWQTTSAGQPDGTAVATMAARVGAFALASGSKDAAVLAQFNSGAHTASTLRPNSATGVALTEIYDADLTSAARVINVSARMNVSPGEGTLIAGLVISGNAPKTLLIRGVGPSLAAFGVTGVLADPRLIVFSGSTEVASNDNWETGLQPAALMSATAAQVGAFGLAAGGRDAALLITLQPGSYTMHVTGVGNTAGVALIEVYDTL